MRRGEKRRRREERREDERRELRMIREIRLEQL